MDLRLYLTVLSVLVAHHSVVVIAECLAGDFNLTALEIWNPWKSVANMSGGLGIFSFNLCGSDPECDGSSICWKNGSESINIANPLSTLSPVLNEQTGGFSINFTGVACGRGSDSWSTTIQFKCGVSLGSPEFLSKSGCALAFEWHTSLVCSSRLAKREVPCYVIDGNNHKRDLSPLIKQTGGYLVDSDGDRDIYINVCRDITPATATTGCPANSSGCLIKDGNNVNTGEANARLTIEGDQLKLMYNTAVLSSGCNGYNPRTKITFVCPREEGRFGGSKDPVLLTDTNCHFDIEWQTEYACEVDMYTSNGDCRFTYDNDGIDIDLRPLKDVTTAFEASTSAGDEFKYYIAVCSSLQDHNFDCGEAENSAVCQEEKEAENPITSRHSTGTSAQFSLRYADGEVTLVYGGGGVCHHNGFQRTSVISFKCNQTAGNGQPKFTSEVHCMYFFEWETEHACLEHSTDTTCRVNHGRQRFDLSSLVRERGSNWVALNGIHDHENNDDGIYYINICANLLQEDLKTTDCPPGSSACFVDHQGSTTSLGQFKESPVYDEGEIVLTYVDGETSGSCTKKTIIRFICAPGDMESAPSLVRKLIHSCEYEFEWRTAAACPLGKRTGENCQVFDEDAGFTFDLTPLSKSGVNQYKVTGQGYDYFLNVCAKVDGTQCDELDIPNPGACQVQKDGTNRYTLGQANSTLEYFDGILKLSYMMGSLYNSNDDREIHRQADIIFLCDINAEDDGSIEFVAEADYVYTFKWSTKYACPQPPVECIVMDEETHRQYDLSSLSKALDEDNWSYVDSRDATSKHKYYINVCRPVNPNPLCGPFAAACQTNFDGEQEIAGIKNLGVASSAPTVESEGNLLMRYVNGSTCSAGSKYIETRIHFRCRPGELASSPYLLEVLDDGCVYSFLWETEAACPILTSKGTECTVEDKNSGYLFNLNSLKSDNHYEPRKKVADLPSTRINVCGGINTCPAINGKPAGACVQDGGNWVSLGYASTNLTYSDDGLLTLIYYGSEIEGSGGRLHEATITFSCNRDITATTKVPETVSCDGSDQCHFNFDTPLACLPDSVDCLVSDSAGNQYDLSSLAKADGNWEAVDTRDGNEHISYHINVCKPLYSLDPEISNCKGGPISACQTNSDSQEASNLGYVQAMPEAADDGTLTIRYVGGDLCDTGGASDALKSTRINFECSETPGSPVFQSVTKFCEYIFTWQTPAACPLKRVTGEGCQVSVPELSYQFDLNSLYDPDKDYEVTTPKYKYSLNVCKKLVSSSGSCDEGNIGGCQEEIANSNGISAGIANGNLMYDNGILRLNYTSGAACHDDVYERSMAINFVCDDTLSDNGHPVFIKETGDCTYQFEWATPLACAPFPQVECSYRGQDGQFDLAPLVNVDDNYEVSGGEENQAFYLTVCRSLRNIPGKKGAACPTNAAACLETQKGGQTKYINLGEVTTGPTMEGDHLVLRYDSGDPCPSGNKKRSTVINFDCDPEAVGSLPEFQYAEDNCTYIFIWMNKLACQITHEDETGRDCKVSNPVTGFEFDLKVLQSIDTVNIFGHDQHVYNISICTPLTDTPCEGKNIGACQSQRDVPSPKHFVTGKFNRQVFFDDGVLSLQYDDGTSCHNDNYKRSTVINFVCPHEHDTLGEPVFISETEDCTYYFSWHTSAACEEFIQCSVMNGTETIDLSPLVQKRGYYIAPSMVDGVGITFVNLCRPLNPIEGTLCPPNAAVCHMKDGKPQSLGRIDEDPQIGADGNVFIKYTNGEKCLEDAKRNVSSIIQFRCQRGEEKGQPTLISYDDCTYTFEWSTYVVCPPAAATDGKGCIYRNDVMEYLFDLNALAQKTYKMNPATGKEISLQLCGIVPAKESPECNGAAVCLKEGSSAVSLGQKSSQEFSFEGGTLRVSYSGGSACPHDENEKMETTILLRCIDSEESEEPTFFTADPDYCHTTLQWDTPIACPPQTMPCTVTDGRGALFDLQGLSQITGSWIVSSSNKNYRYFINVCKPAVNSLNGCPKEATVCREGPTKEEVETVGKIYTQNLEYEEADGKIVLTYTEGLVYTCGEGVNRSGYKAKVRIAFSCSNKVGSPEFESEEIEGENPDTCLVSFSWKSKVACKVKKAPVQLSDGKVTDPETGVELDLRPLLKGESPDGSWLVEGDDRSLTSNSLDQYQYFIMLADDNMERKGESDECETAAVCQSKTDKRFFRNIGFQSEKNYYIEDDTLELVTRNPASCRKDHSDVFSTVIFKCDSEQTPGQPKFLYESGNCQYFFIWETSHVCQLISNGGGNSGGNGTSKGPQRGSFGKVVLAFFMVVSICILVIVFHKRERRSAIYVRIRRCFPGSYANVPTYSYSQLSNGDRSVSTLEETRGLFDSDGEDEEILKETSPNPLEYKDDSDDDLLVDSRV